MSGEAGAVRTFVLVAGFVCGALAGAWLGFVAAFVSGIAPSGPARFPGEDLAAALAAVVAVAASYAVVRRTVGRPAALGLLFVAAYAALDLLWFLYLFAPREVLCYVLPPEPRADVGPNVLLAARQEGAVPECRSVQSSPFSPKLAAAMVPAALVALLLCSAAVRRSALLQLAGLGAGALFALIGLLLSLARAFA